MSCGCKKENNGCNGCGSKRGGGDGNRSGKKHCKTYTLVTKNPYDVGVASITDNNEYILVLSGGHHSTSDFDGDELPDWIGVGERPCRTYQTLSTKDIVELFKRCREYCDQSCHNLTTYKTLCPNAFITYNLVNDLPKSAAVEILDAKLDEDDTGPLICFRVKLLENDDDRLILEELHTRMFRVNLTIDAVLPLGNKKK